MLSFRIRGLQEMSPADMIARGFFMLGSNRVLEALVSKAGLGSSTELLLRRLSVARSLHVPLALGHEASLSSSIDFLLGILGCAGCFSCRKELGRRALLGNEIAECRPSLARPTSETTASSW